MIYDDGKMGKLSFKNEIEITMAKKPAESQLQVLSVQCLITKYYFVNVYLNTNLNLN